MGKRMGNLTHNTPKPLLLRDGKPLIVWQIENIVRANITEIIINVAAIFAKSLQSVLGDGTAFGAHIHYSIETETLETGGGIINALLLLGKQPFIITSADLVTNYPFANLTRITLQPPHTLGHLVLVDNPPYHPTGDYGLVDGIVCLDSTETFNYAGIGLLHPQLFTNRSLTCCKLTDCINPAIANNQIRV